MSKDDVWMRKKLALLSGLVAAGIALDRYTKSWAADFFQRNPPVPIVKDLFELRYAENSAVAFSLLHSLPSGPRRWLIITLTTLEILGLMWLIVRWRAKRIRSLVPLVMIVSGALGNLVDRTAFGYVIDFFHLHYRHLWSWPIFNVADSLIFMGVVLFIILNHKILTEDGKTAADGT